MWAMEKMNDKESKDMIVPDWMMIGKVKVDQEYVSLLCSAEEGSLLVSMWYVLWITLR